MLPKIEPLVLDGCPLPRPFSHFHTTGTPAERGRSAAAFCADWAARWMASSQVPNASRPSVEETSCRLMDQASHFAAEVVDELDALAQALNIPWPAYAARTFEFRESGLPPSCTTFGGIDASGHCVAAKTDDLSPHEIGMNVLQTTVPSQGYAHHKLHFGGTLYTSVGMNSESLFAGLTGIPGPSTDQPGLPSLWLINLILSRCASVAEAMALTREIPVNTGGCSLLLCDGTGQLALVEKNAIGYSEVPLFANRTTAHSNHILDPSLARLSPPQRPALLKNSQARFTQVRAHLDPLASLSRSEACSLLSSQDGICPLLQTSSAPLWTDYAVLAEPAENTFRLWSPSHLDRDMNTISALL